MHVFVAAACSLGVQPFFDFSHATTERFHFASAFVCDLTSEKHQEPYRLNSENAPSRKCFVFVSVVFFLRIRHFGFFLANLLGEEKNFSNPDVFFEKKIAFWSKTSMDKFRTFCSEVDMDLRFLPTFCSGMDFLPTVHRELIVSYLTTQQQFYLTDRWDLITDIEGLESQEISMAVLLWRATQHKPFLPRLCETAARQGHLEVLRWLRAQGCPWNGWTCNNAAKNGHLEVLQWVRAQGCPWSESACSSAAENGHLEVLQWLRAQGCPWNEWTCSSAAENGHLELLQWLRAQGCPWDEWTCCNAAENGHLEVLHASLGKDVLGTTGLAVMRL